MEKAHTKNLHLYYHSFCLNPKFKALDKGQGKDFFSVLFPAFSIHLRKRRQHTKTPPLEAAMYSVTGQSTHVFTLKPLELMV